MQLRPDTEQNRRICDIINNYPNETIVYETVRRLRKKLKSPYAHVVMSALTLAEALMHECAVHVRREVSPELHAVFL
jgi:16S rRNA C1402 (ribose-2'-O) methylase RsmI